MGSALAGVAPPVLVAGLVPALALPPPPLPAGFPSAAAIRAPGVFGSVSFSAILSGAFLAAGAAPMAPVPAVSLAAGAVMAGAVDVSGVVGAGWVRAVNFAAVLGGVVPAPAIFFFADAGFFLDASAGAFLAFSGPLRAAFFSAACFTALPVADAPAETVSAGPAAGAWVNTDGSVVQAGTSRPWAAAWRYHLAPSAISCLTPSPAA